jgi:2-haloacid dehalogenase
MDYSGFDALTFDCYGTLVDWERGILAALPAGLDGELVLEAYAEFESELEGGPYLRYREVLERCYDGLAVRFGFEPDAAQRAAFADSVGDWPPFPDSRDALARLKERFRLGVITNCDDDLFARTNARLGVEFDWVVTAQQVGAYKPDPRGFETAFARMDVPRERILHVAQSLFHDHVTAKRLGLSTVWIDRRGGRGGGATPAAEAKPDATFSDMASFAEAATKR